MEIVVRHLCKSFGDKAVLRDVTFTARAGDHGGHGALGDRQDHPAADPAGGWKGRDSGTVEGLAGKKLSAVFQEDRLLEHLSGGGEPPVRAGAGL